MNQHIIIAPEKLMNILLKLSLPKFCTHRREIKTLKTKDASVDSLWSTHRTFLGHELFIFFLLKAKGAHKT